MAIVGISVCGSRPAEHGTTGSSCPDSSDDVEGMEDAGCVAAPKLFRQASARASGPPCWLATRTGRRR